MLDFWNLSLDKEIQVNPRKNISHRINNVSYFADFFTPPCVNFYAVFVMCFETFEQPQYWLSDLWHMILLIHGLFFQMHKPLCLANFFSSSEIGDLWWFQLRWKVQFSDRENLRNPNHNKFVKQLLQLITQWQCSLQIDSGEDWIQIRGGKARKGLRNMHPCHPGTKT